MRKTAHARHSASSRSWPPPAPAPARSASVSPAASTAVSAAPSTVAAPPRPRASAAACAKDDLAVMTAGKLTIGTDNPAYPPYFAEPATGRQHRAVGDSGDPTNGEGFESAVGYAIAEQARVRQGRGRLDRRAVRELVRARAQDLRHRPQPGLVQARADAGRRPVGRLLLRQPVASSSLKDSPLGEGHDRRRAQGRSSSAPRSGRPAYDTINDVIAADQGAAGLRHQRRGDPGPQATSRSTASSSTCRPPSTSPTSRSRTSVIVGQFASGGTPEHFSVGPRPRTAR